jgi:hypothetical protein
MEDIFTFCHARIKQDRAYRGKHFHSKLSSLANAMSSKPFRTTPGRFLGTVDEKNSGETAFQRALYRCGEMSFVGSGRTSSLTWRDIELPIILSTKSRRRCVDLIGRTQQHGTFLCEVKHAKEDAAVPGNAVDYAIFEALLYYAIIERDYVLLDEEKVYRPPKPPRFSWKAVRESRVVLVLANDYFWAGARQSQNRVRITNLVAAVQDSLNIQMLLSSTPNYAFGRLDAAIPGRYEPQFVSAPKKMCAAGEIFPQYRSIVTLG